MSWVDTMIKEARYGGSDKEVAIWYHGTRGKNLRSILSQGLIPDPKERAWSEDEDASVNLPSRVSIGGIYLTRNLMTAKLAAGRFTEDVSDEEATKESQVIVIVEAQTRSLIADEDDFATTLNMAIDGNHQWLIAEAYMARELGTNDAYVSDLRAKYIDRCLETFKRRFGLILHPQLETRLKSLLTTGWDIALNRQAAHSCRGGDAYRWRSAWESNLSEEGRKKFRNELKRLEESGMDMSEAYRQAISTNMIPQPQSSEAESAFASYVDAVTKALKNVVRPEVATPSFNEAARSLEPIGFSGRNRIVGIVEVFYDRKRFGDHHDRIKIAYGSLPDDFVKQWTERVGPIVMLGDRPVDNPTTEKDNPYKAASWNLDAFSVKTAQISDWKVSLECVCADDFGANHKTRMSKVDIEHAQTYEETREAHQRLENLATDVDIAHYIADTDDKDSKHSDAYLYFVWSELDKVLDILKESGAVGDVLDIPRDFPVILESRVKSEFGWSVEREA